MAEVSSSAPGAARADALGLRGTRLDGKYRVDGVLGTGAMGVVYSALHEALDRAVAIKVLQNLRSKDDLLVHRFRREARTAAKLTHPNSVQVLDFGEEREHGFLYLVMERVPGRSLMDLVRQEGRLPPARLVPLMIQVASVLEVAHRLEIIHRDIKPANILVAAPSEDAGSAETAKVCDFGLAKITSEHADPTATHDPKLKAAGTPVYMAPEQAVGEPLDHRADIYAFGVVLYHLLAGRPPFLGKKSFEILMAHVSKEPTPPRALVPDIPESMERLILWCLAKARDARCPDARALGEALEGIARELGVPAVIGPAASAGGGWKRLSDDLTLEPGPAPAAHAGLGPAGEDTVVLDAPPELPADALVEIASDEDGSAGEPEDDIDRLVARAVAEVEDSQDLHRTHPQETQMAGLDRGRHSDAVAERAAYMFTRYGITYEPYRGEHPFWARDHRGELLGPLGHDDLFRVIRTAGEARTAAEVLVSADEERWMTAEAFIRLVGLERLLEGEAKALASSASGAGWTGSVDPSKLIAVFARVARERMSGRLLLRRGSDEEPERAEIHAINGQPTFVYLNREGMQIPDLLVSQGLLDPDLLAAYMRRALLEERPLETVIAREAGIEVGQWHQRFMRERLRNILPWAGGRFAFDAAAMPLRLTPFAPSLLSVTRDLIYRTSSIDELEVWARPLADAPLSPSRWFADGVRQLRLSDPQVRMVRRMLKRRSLAEALDGEGAHRKMALSLAFLMYEAEILLKPI